MSSLTYKCAVLDGDIILHAACGAATREIHWDENLATIHCDLRDAKDVASNMIEAWMHGSGASRVLIAFSDMARRYFRHDVLSTYKSGRSAKPLNAGRLRAYLEDTYDAVAYPGLEADDVLGMLGSHPSGDHVMVSIDKDLLTVPGALYNPGTDVFVTTTESEANRAHLSQTLTGDSTDGYKGCPGVGPVKAKKILDRSFEDNCGTIHWSAIVAAFEKAGSDEENALTQARLAYILRHGDYNRETQEVTLWNPRATERIES